jgi:hypothetical protein
MARLMARGGPWLLFAVLLAWGWRTTNLWHAVPAYGDALEGLWAVTWLGEALRLKQNPAVYPLAFHPVGWHMVTYAWGPANFLLLLPLYWLGGAAFAYNVATLLTFVIAFAGSHQLARRLLTPLGATVAALLYTFWGFRWYNIIGQLHIGLASAILPWIIWSLDRGIGSRHKSWPWYILAGVLWAVCVNSSLYFIWIGGIAVVGWLIGRLAWSSIERRTILTGLVSTSLVAGLLSLPLVVAFSHARSGAATGAFNILDANAYSASINSLAIPNLSHPWLQQLARSIYLGPPDGEAGLTNLGVLTSIVALVGIVAIWRNRAWRPVLVLACLGLILALGPVLKWNDRIVQWDLLRPVDRLIWKIGYSLKPEFFFGGPQPRGGFRAAVPAPGLLPSVLVPFFEQARVFARYALIGGMAVFLLAARGMEQLGHRTLRLALAVLLIFEVVPPPTASYAFPPPSHPAFEWLRKQDLGGDGILELHTAPFYHLALPIGGEVIWATEYHRQATVAGASSVWPSHTTYLMQWLAEHAHPFQDSDFVPLLRFYRVRLLVLHMYGGWEQDALQEARQNEVLRYVNCFPPSSQASPWHHSICILEVLESSTPQFNLMLRDGWSGPETWGRWIDGTEARASWVATARTPHRLSVEAFPFCPADQKQSISFEVNGTALVTHQWEDCEPWSGEIVIPAGLVRVGDNEVVARADYAVKPSELSGGDNPDPRALSVGFTTFRVEEISAEDP